MLGAPLLARGYAEANPDIVPLIRALTLYLFFEGLSTVPRVYFEGELKIGRAVAPELARNLFMAVTSVTLALLGYGVWSLLIAHVGSAMLYAVMLWWRPQRQWLTFALFYTASIPVAFLRELPKGNQMAAVMKLKGVLEGLRVPLGAPPRLQRGSPEAS